MMETQSQKSVASSRMSGASRLSKPSVAEIRGTKIQGTGSRAGSQADAMSWTSSQQARTEVMEDLNEEDEWTAIMKFNTLLHYEEQKQALLRDKERKRLIREELDNQLKEKKHKVMADVKEDRMYENLQEQHLKLLEQREVEKHDEIKRKIDAEKASRDKQLKEEKHRKRHDQKDQAA